MFNCLHQTNLCGWLNSTLENEQGIVRCQTVCVSETQFELLCRVFSGDDRSEGNCQSLQTAQPLSFSEQSRCGTCRHLSVWRQIQQHLHRQSHSTYTLPDVCRFAVMSSTFVCFLLQSGASVIWRETIMSSFADSTSYSTMTSRWSSLEPQETALRSKEST